MRVLDYAAVSRECEAIMLGTFADEEVPWGPHVGIASLFSRNPRLVTIRACVAPPAKVDAKAIVKNHKEAPALSWNDVPPSPDPQEEDAAPVRALIEAVPVFQNDISAIKHLGHLFSRWSLHADAWLTTTSFPERSPSNATARGQLPIIMEMPAIPACRKEPGAVDALAQHTAILHNVILDYAIARERSTFHVLPALISRVAKARAKAIKTLEGTELADRSKIQVVIDASEGIHLAGASRARQIANTAKVAADYALGAARNNVASEVKEWAVQSLSGSAGQAYKYLKKADNREFIPPSPGEPIPDASARQLDWEAYWVKNRPGYTEAFVRAMAALKPQAMAQAAAPPDITVIQLRAALAAMAPERSRAFDGFTPAELHTLPDESLLELLVLFRVMELACIPPMAFLANLAVVLPKPTGGFRPIGLLACLYAAWENAGRPSSTSGTNRGRGSGTPQSHAPPPSRPPSGGALQMKCRQNSRSQVLRCTGTLRSSMTLWCPTSS